MRLAAILVFVFLVLPVLIGKWLKYNSRHYPVTKQQKEQQ